MASSSFSFYIKRCLEEKYLDQLPEMKAAYAAALEKAQSEYITYSAEANAAKRHLELLQLDDVVGPTWEAARRDNTAKETSARIAGSILDAVKSENDICVAFYNWVQWRYQCAGEFKSKAKDEICDGILKSYKFKKPDEILAFWSGTAPQEAYAT